MAHKPPPRTAIRGFQGEYRFLSNFFIEPDGTHVEGEYQAHKTNPPDWTVSLLSPMAAKRVGQQLQLRHNWDKIKLRIMEELVLKKFQDHENLRQALIDTGDLRLEETNQWGDTYWGVCNRIGMNNLGIILMDVREQLDPRRL